MPKISPILTHTLQSVEDARHYLDELMERFGEPVRELVQPVVQDPRFWIWPASCNRHHTWRGGLAVHTFQVIKTALDMLRSVPNADLDSVVIAGVWHDYGKIWDYEEWEESPTGFREAFHKVTVQHLVRGAIEWGIFTDAQVKQGSMSKADQEFTTHLILAHHFFREWNSPAEPQYVEAYALHAADMLSSQYVRDGETVLST